MALTNLLAIAIKDLAHPDEVVKLAERRRKRLAGEPVESQYETVIVRKDGQPVPVTGAAAVWQAQPATLAMIRGMTERKRAEEELNMHPDHLEELIDERTSELREAVTNLERSNKELEQFAYVAHDLQEPLRMVASYTQLLTDRYAGKLDEKAGKYIAYAVDGATRILRKINDLLVFSRMGARGEPQEPTDCGKPVAEVVQGLEKAVEESDAENVDDNNNGEYVEAISELVAASRTRTMATWSSYTT